MIRKIGIALAAYEPNPEFFAAQLRSIQEQSFQNWVCVVTADSSLEDIRRNPEFTNFFQDERFHWIQNSIRLGHKKNFERAIQETLPFRVDAIACSDQDDLWYREKLQICANRLAIAVSMSVVHSDMHILVDGKIVPRTVWEIERRGVHHASLSDLLIRNVVAGSSMLMDAKLARMFPEIPEAVGFHDHWYALMASAHGGVHPIRQPLYAYRQHSENVVGATPFQGFFSVPKDATVLSLIRKCHDCWLRSHRLAQAVSDAGIRLPGTARLTFLGNSDLGAALFSKAFLNLPSDLPTARASLARAVGKLFHPLLQ